jgi:hypothetical protein
VTKKEVEGWYVLCLCMFVYVCVYVCMFCFLFCFVLFCFVRGQWGRSSSRVAQVAGAHRLWVVREGLRRGQLQVVILSAQPHSASSRSGRGGHLSRQGRGGCLQRASFWVLCRLALCGAVRERRNLGGQGIEQVVILSVQHWPAGQGSRAVGSEGAINQSNHYVLLLAIG